MSQQNAIEKITEAEQRAEVLCRVAGERAAEARADMERKAKEHLGMVERTAAEKNAKNLVQSRAQTDALIRKKREEAEREAEALREMATERMNEAVSAIVWGIIENVSK